jgi:hypothetical protein
MATLDPEGYPLDAYNEVIPRLAQASSWISPGELLAEHGFDVSVDVGGWDQSDRMNGRRYVFMLIDDVPSIPDPDGVHMLGRGHRADPRGTRPSRSVQSDVRTVPAGAVQPAPSGRLALHRQPVASPIAPPKT